MRLTGTCITGRRKGKNGEEKVAVKDRRLEDREGRGGEWGEKKKKERGRR
jgi:hypothetical protein